MKKLFVSLLSLMLILSLCACEKLEAIRQVELPPLPEVTFAAEEAPAQETPVPDAEETAAPEQGAGPEETEVPAEGINEPEATELSSRVIVHITRTALEAFDPAEGTERILEFSYETPYVDIEGRDQAAETINSYLALLDETYYTGNDYGLGEAVGYNLMLEMAEDNYGYVMGTGAENVPLLFTADRTARTFRGDGQLLSLVYADYSFTGGVHGSTVLRGYVFDTETGDRLRLETLSEDYSALSAFLVEYMIGLTKSAPETYAEIDSVQAEDYADAFAALLRDGSWYLDEEGMVIFSDLYEISSYAAGILEFRIPYGELKGKIYDKYLPQDKQGSGQVDLLPMALVEDGTLEILDRVSTGTEGEELYLVVEGTVYDLRIARGEFTDAFNETAQLWYASHMRDCAVQISALLPEGMPELAIRYSTADGEQHTLFLLRDGNGDPTLTDLRATAEG